MNPMNQIKFHLAQTYRLNQMNLIQKYPMNQRYQMYHYYQMNQREFHQLHLSH